MRKNLAQLLTATICSFHLACSSDSTLRGITHATSALQPSVYSIEFQTAKISLEEGIRRYVVDAPIGSGELYVTTRNKGDYVLVLSDFSWEPNVLGKTLGLLEDKYRGLENIFFQGCAILRQKEGTTTYELMQDSGQMVYCYGERRVAWETRVVPGEENSLRGVKKYYKQVPSLEPDNDVEHTAEGLILGPHLSILLLEDRLAALSLFDTDTEIAYMDLDNVRPFKSATFGTAVETPDHIKKYTINELFGDAISFEQRFDGTCAHLVCPKLQIRWDNDRLARITIPTVLGLDVVVTRAPLPPDFYETVEED